MKKILALLVAGVMTVCGVQAASAAEVTDDDLTAVNTSAKYKVVTTLNIKQGTMLLYPYNLSSSATDLFVMKNETKDTSRTIYFKEFYNRPKSISISSSDTYTPYMGCGGGYGGGGSFTYNNTGGKYDVIKVKISDLISGLNKDGSVTKYNSALKKDVTYKFTEQFEDNGDTVMFAPGEPFYGTPGKGKNEIRIAYVLKQADLERAMDLLALGIKKYNETH